MGKGKNIYNKNLVGFLVSSLVLLCVSCNPSEESIEVTRQAISPTPTLASPSAPATLAASTVTPTSTSSHATVSPTSVPTAVPEPICPLDKPVTTNFNTSIQDAILFISNRNEPLTHIELALPKVRIRGYAYQLWAISPNGNQISRLTDEYHGIGWHASDTALPPVLLLSNANLTIDPNLVQPIQLPAECEGEPEGDTSSRYRCGDFNISPDRKWATFNVGDYVTGYNTQPALINLESNEVSLNTIGTDIIRFLPNDERLVGNWWGEGGEIWWANSQTGESLRLGSGGLIVWNDGETAFAVESTPYAYIGGTVWGYNVATSNLFLPELGKADSKPIWAPDDFHILYQHQTITRTQTFTVTLSPREIHLVNAASGEQQTILSDPRYDYHLCQKYDDNDASCQWKGDWIRVRQIPYSPRPFYFEDSGSAYQCSWNGLECPGGTIPLGLNWRTGEVLPWEKIQSPPAPKATPQPVSGPDLTSEPIYSNSDVGYALYIGNDNRSLWCVAEQEKPVQWIESAEMFIYVP